MNIKEAEIIKMVNSGIYRNDLVNFLNTIDKQNLNSETDIIKYFETWLNNLLKKHKAIEENTVFHISSEVKVKLGSIDSKYRDIFIEYKKFGRLDSKKEIIDGTKQLKNKYLLDEQFKNQRVFGFLFDGKSIFSFIKNPDNKIYDIKEKSGKLDFKKLDYFIKNILSVDKKEISALNFKNDFGILDDDFSKPSVKILRSLFKSIKKTTNTRTLLLYKEWEKLFKLSEDDSGKHEDIGLRRKELTKILGIEICDADDEYKGLYALHSTLSIILKLIAIKIINNFTVNKKDSSFASLQSVDTAKLKLFFDDLEHGILFKNNGVLNLIEGDFFAWYIKEGWDESLSEALNELIITLTRYEDIKFLQNSEVQDFFHDLYEGFVPSIIRHSFGEYYTPYWLADLVIESAIKEKGAGNNNFSLIDTTCGSGTFLINAIKRKIKNGDNVKNILKHVNGIDLNPLAVLMAKINYFINIFPYLNDGEIIQIPVFLGDATYIPQIDYVDGVKVLNYDLLTSQLINDGELKITFPYSLVERNDFVSIMEELEFHIIKNTRKSAIEFIFSKVNKNELNANIQKVLTKFIDDLIYLETEKLNSIWLRIFANYLKTGAIGKFDMVVGNPPWISWGALPEKYREKVKSKCNVEGLFSNDKNVGGNNLNICALIANKSLETFMNDDGVLSYIMPKSILFNKSFEGFRNFYIENKSKRAYLRQVLDWEDGGRPFNGVSLPFAIYTFSFKPIDYEDGISLLKYVAKKDRNVENIFVPFSEIEDNYDIIQNYLIRFKNQLNNNFTIVKNKNEINELSKIVGENNYTFRKGVGYKGEIFRLYFVKNINNDLAQFRLFEKIGKNFKLSNQEVILEKKLIKPLILSPDIADFKVNWKNLYIIYPYNNGEKQPIKETELKILAPKIYNYFKSNYKKIVNQSKYNERIQNSESFYNLIRVGNYCYANYFVAIRDNTKMTATVVSKIKTHWGTNEMPVFDGHVSYISEREKGTKKFISKSEAEYIVNILNKPLVKSFIKNSTDNRSIGTKLPIKIDKFIE